MKKIVSTLLSVLMACSVFVGVTITAYDKDSDKAGGTKTPVEIVVQETTNNKGETGAVTDKGGIYDGPFLGKSYRYYFAMPKEWYTFSNANACAYWWNGTDSCENWQHSYKMKSTPIVKTDGTKVFYIDVAIDVKNIIFSNGIDIGTKDGDVVSANWGKSYQTDNISLEGYSADENYIFPDGIDNFNNLVYVINTKNSAINEKTGSVIYDGEWNYLHDDGNWDEKPGSPYKLESTDIKLSSSKISLDLAKNKTKKLKANVTNGRFDTIVKWISSDERIAKVDRNGVVTAVGYGVAVISASIHNPGEVFIKSDKCVVNVVKSAEKKTSVTLLTPNTGLYVKGTLSIRSVVNNGVGKTTFKSSNSKVAKVDNKGKVTALKSGKAKITVTNNKVSKTLTVTVKNPKLNKTKLTLSKNRSAYLVVIGKIGKATFSSSNKNIATVNSAGKVTGKKNGKAVITVKSNGVTLKCSVVVK